jgi:hypothetical protein
MWIRILDNNKEPKMQNRNGGAILEEWLNISADLQTAGINKRTRHDWLLNTSSFRGSVPGGKVGNM